MTYDAVIKAHYRLVLEIPPNLLFGNIYGTFPISPNIKGFKDIP